MLNDYIDKRKDSLGNTDVEVVEKDIDLSQVENKDIVAKTSGASKLLRDLNTEIEIFKLKKEIKGLIKEIAGLLNIYEKTLPKLERSPEHLDIIKDKVKSNPLSLVYDGSFAFFTGLVDLLIIKNEMLAQCKPLFKKWKLADKAIETDEEFFEEFLSDLAHFSATHPQIRIGELTIDKYFQQKLWSPYFEQLAKRAKIVNYRLATVKYLKDSRIHKLIRSNFESISPFEFEDLIGDLFIKMGYSVQVTPKSGDYGIDVIAVKGEDVIAIQAKKYSKGNNVGNQEIQKLLGAMQLNTVKANKAILITSSDFTVSALIQAKETPIELWNGDYLSELLKKVYKYGLENLPEHEIERRNQLYKPIINRKLKALSVVLTFKKR
jgi:uncharacterized protein YihD (DUF1040 family)